MTTQEAIKAIQDILDNDCTDLSREDYREVLEEIESDCQSRLAGLDSDDAMDEK